MVDNIWSSFSKSYDEVIPQMDCYQRMQRKIIDYSAGADLVIDAGCGTGIISESLARLGKTVVGFDNNPAMLDLAYKKQARFLQTSESKNWRILAGDVSNFPPEVPYEAGMIIFNNVLFFIRDCEPVLNQAFAHLKKGGVIVITGPRKRPDAAGFFKKVEDEWVAAHKLTPELKSSFDHHVQLGMRLTSKEMTSFFLEDELVDTLRRVGFTEVLEATGEDYYGENFFVAMRK